MNKILTSITIATLVLMALGTTFIFSGLGNPSEISSIDITLSNEQIQLLFTDEAVGIGNYTDDTVEPKGWELFPSLYWDANGNEIFDDEEQMVSTVFPTVHFTENAQDYTFSPLHQSIMQDPGDAEIIFSGWISEPNVYASEVKDIDELVTVNNTVSIYNGNNYFTQKLDITSTASTTLTDVTLIVYFGMDIQGFFDDFAFIDAENNNMIKAKDNGTETWFGAYPTTASDNYEISIWDDGPSDADDLWQHCLDNNLNGQTTADNDVEGVLQFNLQNLNPGENKSITFYCSFAHNENELYPSTPPPTIVYVDDDFNETTPGWGYDHFDNIQEGIDAVEELGSVYVYNGIYIEHVTIDKTINLTGEDKYETVIQGDDIDDIITVTDNFVKITGFNITQGNAYNGIHIDQAEFVQIYDNTITYCLNGIAVENSRNNSIYDNIFLNNTDDGIDVYTSSRDNIIKNNSFDGNAAGVFINGSTYNIVDYNMISNSSVFGIQLYNYADHNIISNNTVILTKEEIFPQLAGVGIFLFIQNHHNIIENNEIYENKIGISINYTSTNNIVTSNNIYENWARGVQIYSSSDDNTIYHNNIFNNTQNAYDECTNNWDNGYGTPFNSSTDGGNYWGDDYDGEDLYHGPNQDILGSDNFGDTPYDISGGSNQDRYPLMHPWGVEGFYLDLNDFPMYEAESDPGYNEMCGPAVAQMTLNYIWWNSSNHSQPPMLFDNQTWLYERGIENNSNPDLPYLDTRGLWYIIQYNKPMPYSTFGYNFMKYSSEDLDEALKRIVLWINYTVGTVGGHKEGYPLHVPSVVPAYGDYTNWMAIRGFHANRTAHPMPDKIMIYGFWVNDPLPGGIGENSYKMLASWVNDYYQPLETDDIYNGKYVAILEPPEINENAELTIAESQPRFTLEQQDELKFIQLNKGLVSEDLVWRSNEWIIQAAIEGVAQDLIPYDDDFASAFAKTIAGTPIFVENNNGNNYYAVPFNVLVKKSRSLDLSKKIISKENTIIVILIDAEDGSFKEASWVKDPVKYLPISEKDAQKIVYQTLEEMGYDPEDIETITMNLVHRDSTLYYPDWKVTIDELELEFFIKQDGTIS